MKTKSLLLFLACGVFLVGCEKGPITITGFSHHEKKMEPLNEKWINAYAVKIDYGNIPPAIFIQFSAKDALNDYINQSNITGDSRVSVMKIKFIEGEKLKVKTCEPQLIEEVKP